MFEGPVVSLFAFDSRSVVKHVDAVSNRFLDGDDGVPSFVSETFTHFSVQCHVFSEFEWSGFDVRALKSRRQL